MTAERLAAHGITRPTQLFDASNDVLRSIRFGAANRLRLAAYRQAVEENRPIWLPGPAIELPQQVLFYDVETGLSASIDEGPWLIGALAPDSEQVAQWIAVEAERPQRQKMLRAFLDFVRAYPQATLCSWSGTHFDSRAIANGLRCWYRNPKAWREWDELPQLDLLTVLKPQLMLPTPDWSLKTIAAWLGFPQVLPDDLDGFEVGLLYEEHREWATELPIEAIRRYNEWDVRALAAVFHSIRPYIEALSIQRQGIYEKSPMERAQSSSSARERGAGSRRD